MVSKYFRTTLYFQRTTGKPLKSRGGFWKMAKMELKVSNSRGKKVTIIWNYLEIDDDMLDTGKEYEEIVKIPFEYKIIEDF